MPVLRGELELGDLAEEAPRAVPQVRADLGHSREGRRRRRHGADSGSISGYLVAARARAMGFFKISS